MVDKYSSTSATYAFSKIQNCSLTSQYDHFVTIMLRIEEYSGWLVAFELIFHLEWFQSFTYHSLVSNNFCRVMVVDIINFFSLCHSMEKILERYERYSYAERQLVATDSELQVCHSINLQIIISFINMWVYYYAKSIIFLNILKCIYCEYNFWLHIFLS